MTLRTFKILFHFLPKTFVVSSQVLAAAAGQALWGKRPSLPQPLPQLSHQQSYCVNVPEKAKCWRVGQRKNRNKAVNTEGRGKWSGEEESAEC